MLNISLPRVTRFVVITTKDGHKHEVLLGVIDGVHSYIRLWDEAYSLFCGKQQRRDEHRATQNVDVHTSDSAREDSVLPTTPEGEVGKDSSGTSTYTMDDTPPVLEESSELYHTAIAGPADTPGTSQQAQQPGRPADAPATPQQAQQPGRPTDAPATPQQAQQPGRPVGLPAMDESNIEWGPEFMSNEPEADPNRAFVASAGEGAPGSQDSATTYSTEGSILLFSSLDESPVDQNANIDLTTAPHWVGTGAVVDSVLMDIEPDNSGDDTILYVSTEDEEQKHQANRAATEKSTHHHPSSTRSLHPIDGWDRNKISAITNTIRDTNICPFA